MQPAQQRKRRRQQHDVLGVLKDVIARARGARCAGGSGGKSRDASDETVGEGRA